MFGKIKDKLKNVFNKSEELIEENPDEIIDEPVEEIQEESPKEKTEKKEKSKQKKEASKSSTKKTKKEDTSPEEESTKPKSKPKKKEKEIVEDSKEKPDELQVEELSTQENEETSLESDDEIEEKKGFLSKVFGSKKEESIEEVQEEKPVEDSKSIFSKLKSKKVTEDDFDKIWIELQIFLLEINIAYEIVGKIEKRLKEELIGNSFSRFKISQTIRQVLETEVETVLKKREENFLNKLNEIKKEDKLVKILVLGVNGTGKTTTIAKIVNYFQKHNLSVAVAAADTFRAAATEQLEEHSKKLNFKLIVHKGGSDPAAVAFDAIEHAKAKNLDVVLIDTAGRMPNNSNLMLELQKIKRVSNAQMGIFVGDSISGNDLIDQINLFDKGVEIDGVILTKVDTDERPGSIVTTAYSIEKPIYFLGIGQAYDDLIEFNSKEIAKKLFEINEE